MSERQKFENVDQYIESFGGDVRTALEQLRNVLRDTFSGSTDVISYNIPAFKNGSGFIMYFSGYTNHVSLSFVPTEPVYEKFSKQLAPYVKSKSTIQFPLSEPLPINLIKQIAKFRLKHQNDR